MAESDGYMFDQATAQRIVRSVRVTESRALGSGGIMPGELEQVHRIAKLTTDLGGGKWAANELEANLTTTISPGWDAANPIQLIGPPMKPGLIVAVFQRPSTGTMWFGYGYEWCKPDNGELDGTTPTSSLIVESSTLKEKKLVTDDGITWTKIKVNVASGPCA